MPLVVRLDADLEEMVDLVARRLRQSRSAVVRAALREYCAGQGGGSDAFEAVRHLAGVANGGPTDLAGQAERYLRESFGGRRRPR